MMMYVHEELFFLFFQSFLLREEQLALEQIFILYAGVVKMMMEEHRTPSIQ